MAKKKKEEKTEAAGTISRTGFLKVLEKVKPGLASKDIIQQATDVILNEGEVSTYNDFVLVSCLFNTGIVGAVKAKELFQMLQRMQGEDVSLEAVQEGLMLRCGKARACIMMDPEITLPLPDLAAMDDAEGWTQIPDGLMDAVKFCLFSASRDLSRGVLTCIHVDMDMVESCDNFRATRRDVEGSTMEELLIPVRAAEDLVKYAVTEVLVEEAWLYFRNADGLIFACRRMDGDWPDISGPFEIEGASLTLPDGFKEVVERAGVLAQAEFDADRRVEVRVVKKVMQIRSGGPAGRFEEDIALDKYKGPDLRFIVHPGDFADVLGLSLDMVVGEQWLKFSGEGFQHVVCLMEV